MLLKSREGIDSHALKKRIQGQIRQVMLDTVSDDLQLLEVVGRGEQTWRINFLRAFPRGAVDETIANKVFAYFCGEVVRRFGNVPVSQLLDALEVNVERPPTLDEIEEGWEIHTASSEEARRLFDLPTGDAYKPKREEH